jgi:WD40 repeat protein
MRYVQGLDGGGVGALAVDPLRTHLAVAERGNCPNIYIYSYPELQVVTALRDGTERSYSDVNFSASGKTLVSVGSFPDFLLTVWDWAAGAVVLRTKAFGQEVFNARFSPLDDSKLTTSGTGHVRFWRMADTFTGLKLQGDLGKFGRVDLSDIHAFAECPDGKVVTGSESGMLLVWDGALIKTQVGRADAQGEGGVAVAATSGAHDAAVHVVHLDTGLGLLVTGGDDGFVRMWSSAAVDGADVLPDGLTVPGLVPVGEASLGSSARIRSILKLKDEASTGEEGGREITWLVADGAGSLWRVGTRVSKAAEGGGLTVSVLDTEAVLLGHAGPVTGAALSPIEAESLAATVGADGSVRCWDVSTASLVLSSRFRYAEGTSSLRATCLAWAPLGADPRGRTLAAAFSDGTLRVLYRGGDEWKRLLVLKPHTGAVAAIAYAPDGCTLATVSADGTVFFFALRPRTGAAEIELASAPEELRSSLALQHTPVGFVSLTPLGADSTSGQLVAGTALCWAGDSGSLSVGCADGSIRVFVLPPGGEWPSTPDNLDLEAAPSGSGLRMSACVTLAVELQQAAPVEVVDKKAVEKGEKGKGKPSQAEVAPEEVPADIIVPGTPGGITALACPAPGRLLVGVSRDGSHLLHELALPGPKALPPVAGGAPTALRPAASYPVHAQVTGEALPQPRVASLAVVPSTATGGAIIVGTTAGSLFVRALSAPAASMQLALHDGAAAEGSGISGVRATAAAFRPDGTLRLLSGGSDGSVALTSVAATAFAALAAALSPSSAAALASPKPLDVRTAGRVGFGFGPALPAPGATAAAPRFLPALPPPVPSSSPAAAPVEGEASPADAWLASPAQAAVDIVDPAAYSLQQVRLHSAADARLAAAEQHKVRVRRVIASLREGFAALRAKIAEEAAVHASRGLVPSDLVLDAGLDAELRAQGEARVRAVDEEMAYDRQVRRVALSLLTGNLVGGLETEEGAGLTGLLDGALRVRALRQVALPSAVAADITAAQAEAAVVGSAQLGKTAPPPSHAPVLNPRAGVVAVDGGAVPDAATAASPLDTASLINEISFEARKASRMARREQLRLLKGARPAPSDEYAPDAAAVLWAASHAGDFPLKASKSYAVPEGVRLDAGAKRRQLLVLEGHAHTSRAEFNARLACATSRKRGVLAACVEAEEEVGAIEAELSASGSTGRILAAMPGGLAVALASVSAGGAQAAEGASVSAAIAAAGPPHATTYALAPLSPSFSFSALRTSLPPEEGEGWVSLPALAARHIADAHAEVELARARAAALEAGVADAENAARAAVPTLSTFHARLAALAAGKGGQVAAGGTPVSAPSASAVAAAGRDPLAAVLAPGLSGRAAASGLGGFSFLPGSLTAVTMTDGATLSLPAPHSPPAAPSREAASAALRTARALLRRKESLRATQLALSQGFDAVLARLRADRLAVAELSAHAALRSIQQRGELSLLSEMAMKDAALEGRLNRAKADKAGIASAQASLAATIAERRAELDALAVKERAVLAVFAETVGSGHPANSALLKIYRRKIKRAKAPSAPGAAVAEVEEDDLDDDLDDLGDEDDEDEEEETCPDNCDKVLYERVLGLRNRRLDVADQLDEVNKALDEARKGAERQTQREKQVDRDLSSISSEIVTFAREKQGKLNALDTFAVVTLSQVTGGAAVAAAARGEGGEGAPAPVALPSSIDSHVLMPRAALARLRARTGELEAENARLGLGLKALKTEERRLGKERGSLEAEITEVRTKARELAILKFGKTLDLEALDRTTGTSADALSIVEGEASKAAAEAEADVAGVKARMAALQERLTAVTQAHTSALHTIAALTARHAALEGELSGRVDRSLVAVALHATIGTPMAFGLAQPGAASSLSALGPSLSRAGVTLGEGKEEGPDPNSTAAVVAGLALSGRHGASTDGPVVTDPSIAAAQDAAEKTRLEMLVQEQGAQLAALQARVALLKSKRSYGAGIEAIEKAAAEGTLELTGSGMGRNGGGTVRQAGGGLPISARAGSTSKLSKLSLGGSKMLAPPAPPAL